MANNYIQGLKPSVRDSIAQAVRLMSDNDKKSLAVVGKAAVSHWKAQRLLLGEGGAKDVTSGKKQPETKKAVKYARTRTLLIP